MKIDNNIKKCIKVLKSCKIEIIYILVLISTLIMTHGYTFPLQGQLINTSGVPSAQGYNLLNITLLSNSTIFWSEENMQYFNNNGVFTTTLGLNLSLDPYDFLNAPVTIRTYLNGDLFSDLNSSYVFNSFVSEVAKNLSLRSDLDIQNFNILRVNSINNISINNLNTNISGLRSEVSILNHNATQLNQTVEAHKLNISNFNERIIDLNISTVQNDTNVFLRDVNVTGNLSLANRGYLQCFNSSVPPTPVGDTGVFYCRDDGSGEVLPYFLSNIGTEYSLGGGTGGVTSLPPLTDVDDALTYDDRKVFVADGSQFTSRYLNFDELNGTQGFLGNITILLNDITGLNDTVEGQQARLIIIEHNLTQVNQTVEFLKVNVTEHTALIRVVNITANAGIKNNSAALLDWWKVAGGFASGGSQCDADGNCYMQNLFLTGNTTAVITQVAGGSIIPNATNVYLIGNDTFTFFSIDIGTGGAEIRGSVNITGDLNLTNGNINCNLIDGGSDSDYCTDLNTAYDDAGVTGNVTILKHNLTQVNQTVAVLKLNSSEHNARIQAVNLSAAQGIRNASAAVLVSVDSNEYIWDECLNGNLETNGAGVFVCGVDDTGGGGGGSGVSNFSVINTLDFVAAGAAGNVWVNMPTGSTEFGSNAFQRQFFNVTDYDEFSWLVDVSVAGISANSRIWFLCSSNNGTTWKNISKEEWGFTRINPTGVRRGQWNPINKTQCSGDALFTIWGDDGNGAVDPNFRQVKLYLRKYVSVSSGTSYDDSGIVGNVTNLNVTVEKHKLNITNFNARIISLNGSIPSKAVQNSTDFIPSTLNVTRIGITSLDGGSVNLVADQRADPLNQMTLYAESQSYDYAVRNIGIYGKGVLDYGAINGDQLTIGVLGNASNNVEAAGTGYGVMGVLYEFGDAPYSWGVGAGVYGGSTNLYGVQGVSTNNAGVYGTSTGSYGGYFSGVVGVLGSGTSSYGVSGTSSTGYSGYFIAGRGVLIDRSLNVSGGLDVDSGTLYVNAGKNHVGFGTTQPGLSLKVSSGDVQFDTGFTYNGTSKGLNITGGVTVDAGTFYVDAGKNRVGVGLTQPLGSLHVRNSVGANITVDSSNSALNASLILTDGGTGIGTEGFIIDYNSAVGDAYLKTTYNNDASSIHFVTKGNQERMTIQGSGLVNVTQALNVSGALTVDSGTLYVDSGNNRVGVGTTQPGLSFKVNSGDVAFGSGFVYNGTSSSVNVTGGLTIDTSTFYVDAGNNQVSIGSTLAADVMNVNFGISGNTAIYGGLAITNLVPPTPDVVLTAGQLFIGAGLEIDAFSPTVADQQNFVCYNSTTGVFHTGSGLDKICTRWIRTTTINNSGGVTFDTNTLYVNAGLNKVGVLNTQPNGSLQVQGNIIVGNYNTAAGATQSTGFSTFGNGTKDTVDITNGDDVYISDDLEVDGQAWFGAYGIADIAEMVSMSAVENTICDDQFKCVIEANMTKRNELLPGDLVCINKGIARSVTRCSEANSQYSVGFISNTSVLNMGEGEYPLAVAGVVYAKVSNENGNVAPGDLLVSSKTPGYAMKNNEPKDGTVVGKAFDFCDEQECTIQVFVALS